MVFVSRREKRLWSAAGLCILLIYASLYSARPLAEWLREANLLRLAVAAAFLSAAVMVGLLLRAQGAGWRVFVAVAGVGTGYLILLVRVPMMPEERLHFLQYGVVAALIYLALDERRARRAENESMPRGPLTWLPPLPLAALLTTLVGWLDEGIQAVLPNRVYDLRDVAFNAVAAVVCLLAVQLVRWVWSRE
jgi:hypothetical protein